MSKEVVISGDERMSVAEVADVLGYEYDTIRKKVKELFPDIVRNGLLTLLTVEQVTELKKHLVPRTLALKSEVDNASTDIEMMQRAADVMKWMLSKIEEEHTARIEAERRNAVLMHVSKLYTATEIAKELSMRSAQELNEALAQKHIQFKQNGTWLPCADYADLGYFSIKQNVLDNGTVVYDRKITQDGRVFILNLFREIRDDL